MGCLLFHSQEFSIHSDDFNRVFDVLNFPYNEFPTKHLSFFQLFLRVLVDYTVRRENLLPISAKKSMLRLQKLRDV